VTAATEGIPIAGRNLELVAVFVNELRGAVNAIRAVGADEDDDLVRSAVFDSTHGSSMIARGWRKPGC
jgi:hypothetical protein